LHEVVGDELISVAESRVWGSEPGTTQLGPLPTSHPLLHSAPVRDDARVVGVRDDGVANENGMGLAVVKLRDITDDAIERVPSRCLIDSAMERPST
jgi:hypothetical protein